MSFQRRFVMKRMGCVLLLCYTLSVMQVFGQDVNVSCPHVEVMSPEAASLAHNIDYNVDLYSGTLNSNIPLYTIEVGDFKMPISLNYNSSGIKVAQEATCVGLGWTLNVGGRISRSVRFVDDFLEDFKDPDYPFIEQGYYDAPDFANNPSILYKVNNCSHYWSEDFQFNVKWSNIYDPRVMNYTLVRDGEPDIFYYSLPTMSGKFLLDKSRGAVLYDKKHNIKIEVVRKSELDRVAFRVTDSDGNIYSFKSEEISKNYKAKGYINKNYTTNDPVYDLETHKFWTWRYNGGSGTVMDPYDPVLYEPYPITSCWCLDEIITSQKHHIKFEYEREDQSLPARETCEQYHIFVELPESQSASYFKSKLINNALRLKKISWDWGTISFDYSRREDMRSDNSPDTPKKLDQIRINSGNELVKTISFSYSYFNKDVDAGGYDYVFKRLRLDRLHVSDQSNDYVFTYFDGEMPAKNSNNVDYWGYSNGRNYGANYSIGVYVETGTGTKKYNGIRKSPNFEYAKIGTLCGIEYPTGGKTMFEYECNEIHPYFVYQTVDATETTPLNSLDRTDYYENIDTYKDGGMHEYPDYPEDSVYRFEIKGKTILTITGNLETISNEKDSDYPYHDEVNNPIVSFVQILPDNKQKNLYRKECPYVFLNKYQPYDNIPMHGEGENILMEKTFILEKGIYEFHSYCPPKEVHAEWRLHFNLQYNPWTLQEEKENHPSKEYGGGLRIKRITSEDGVKTYTYPIGTLVAIPTLYYFSVFAPYANTPRGTQLVQVSELFHPLTTFGRAISVGYDWVRECVEAEKSENVTCTKTYFINNEEREQFDDKFIDSPYEINYDNGFIEKREYEIDDQIVKKEEYTYSETKSNPVYVWCDKSMGPDRSQVGFVDQCYSYDYIVRWPMLESKTETYYYDDNQETSVCTNYSYNDRLLVSKKKQKVGQDVYTTSYKYPFTSSDDVCGLMTQANVVSTPVEVFTTKNDIVVNGYKMTYSQRDSMFLPLCMYTLSRVSLRDSSRISYRKDRAFGLYDEHGNLLETTKDNQKTCYLWGYKGQYCIAEIVGMAYSEVERLLGSDKIKELYDSQLSCASLREALRPLQSGQKPVAVTAYAYIPLVGVESITPPDGNTLFYKYSQGKLSKIMDVHGKVLEQYNYHYYVKKSLTE